MFYPIQLFIEFPNPFIVVIYCQQLVIKNDLEDIVDREMFNALDNVISYKFPNGVEEDELTEFFINEQDYIRKKLGIEKDND